MVLVKFFNKRPSFLAEPVAAPKEVCCLDRAAAAPVAGQSANPREVGFRIAVTVFQLAEGAYQPLLGVDGNRERYSNLPLEANGVCLFIFLHG